MNTKHQIIAIYFLTTSLLISSCGPGPLPEVTPTPIPAPTSSPTPVPTPTPIVRAGIGIYLESNIVETAIDSKMVDLSTIFAQGDVLPFDFTQFGRAIPAEWYAAPQGLPRYEIVITPSLATVIATCQYVPGGTVGRVQLDIDVSVTDLEDHKLIGTNHFTGGPPRPCPQTFSSGRNVIFGLPTVREFEQWVLNTIPATARVSATPGQQEVVELVGVTSVAFSPDGRMLAGGTYDNKVKLWDVASGQALYTLRGHSGYVESVAFSPDGRTLASASNDQTVKLWDVASWQEPRTLRSQNLYSEKHVAFSPDGQTLGWSDNSDVRLWDVASGKDLLTLRGGQYSVENLAFSPDGQTLASVARTVTLWDVGSGRKLNALSEISASNVAFSPDGQTLAVVDILEGVTLWNISSGQALHAWSELTGLNVAFSPDGKLLVATSSNDQTVKLWEVASGKVLHTLSGHKDHVGSVVFSPDGKMLASGSNDGTVKLWDVATGKLLLEIKNTPW